MHGENSLPSIRGGLQIGHSSISAAAGGRGFLLRALQGHHNVAQGKRGAGAPRAALGQRSHHFLLSPESPAFWAIRGERSGEGGSWLPIPEFGVSFILSMFLGTKHDLREWARSYPLTLALSPN